MWRLLTSSSSSLAMAMAMAMAIEIALSVPTNTTSFFAARHTRIEQIAMQHDKMDCEVEKLTKMNSEALAKKEPPYAPLKEQISIDDFFKVDLHVGLINQAEG